MKVKSGILGLIAAAVLASCSTGNDVVSGRNIQKRKYNDGYYFAGNNKIKNNTKADRTEETINAETLEFAEVNEVIKPVVDKVETPSLNQSAIETTIPAGMPEELVFEASETDSDVTSTDKSVARPLNVVKSEQKVTFKPGRISPKVIQQTVSDNSGSSADAMLILLVILCFFIPPLAVFIFEGATSRFWIDLILALIGFGVGFWLFGFGLAYLCALAAVIYALLIVLSVI